MFRICHYFINHIRNSGLVVKSIVAIDGPRVVRFTSWIPIHLVLTLL